MKTLIAILRGDKFNANFPPIMTAAMVYQKAAASQCERIRVELPGGVRVSEFSLDTVRQFIRQQELHRQPDQAISRLAQGELHRPVWAVGQGARSNVSG
ncbi:MAG TPA: hypothetical protein VIV12_09590 [Streptosporangiaceae bacterium]